MIPAKYLHVLALVMTRLEGKGINWVLTGSLAFALQGVPVQPHDIDLQTDRVGAYQIEQMLVEFSKKPVAFAAAEQICSYYGALQIEGIDVEIMGDVQKRLADGRWEAPPRLNEHRQFIQVGDSHVPVLSLAYEAESYRKMGRLERAALLASWAAASG
jgi:hypothetical protein